MFIFCLPTDLEQYSAVYTEVEPYRDGNPRPVLIFGVAAEALIEQLLEEHPDTFTSPKTGMWVEQMFVGTINSS